MKKYFLILFVFMLFAGGITDSSNEPEKFSVEYQVTGSVRKVDITYENETGGTSQLSDVSIPWSHSFTGHPGDFVYISAQNQDSTGTITATITKNGATFKTSTSSGAYVIASADGSL